jgi:patatin-like phospholipase/acyl hydrolase
MAVRNIINEEIAIMKTDINYLKEGVSDLKNMFKEFVDKADSKYATKEELFEIKNMASWNRDRIMDLVYKAGVIIGILYIVFGTGV